ncbi:MAG: DUF2332 domain-containing protein [Actinomycetota bacterium]
MRDPWEQAELAQRFRESAEASRSRAPLNAALAEVVAADASLTGLLHHAPPDQRLPVLLFAALHDLVLDGLAAELRPWYRTVTPDHRSPDDRDALRAALRTTVHEYGPRIAEAVATRQTQTNEIGRCALFLAGLGVIDAGGSDRRPIAHVDVGASAGLNLSLPRLRYRYDDDAVVEDTSRRPSTASPLVECSTRGDGPVPRSIPDVVTSVGIDRSPLDVRDADDARWLRACCWPDQVDRFERLDAALAMAVDDPPTIVEGDAVDTVESVVESVGTVGSVVTDVVPVVTTSWVLNYLPGERRAAFVETLDRIGRSRDLAWVFAEAPTMTRELPHAPDQLADFTTALTTVTWNDGERAVRHLGLCHPHGYWIHWR